MTIAVVDDAMLVDDGFFPSRRFESAKRARVRQHHVVGADGQWENWGGFVRTVLPINANAIVATAIS